MALSTFVKISNVNNLSDARYAAGMGVDLLGFDLEESSSNYVSPEKFKEITGWISGPRFVAEFNLTHPDRMLKLINDYPEIAYLEISEAHHLKMLLNTNFGLIFKIDINKEGALSELLSQAKFYKEAHVIISLESKTEELKEGQIAQIAELAESVDLLLGFGLDSGNVKEILKLTKVKGIALKGGDEIKPGLKDFDELSEILEVLEIED